MVLVVRFSSINFQTNVLLSFSVICLSTCFTCPDVLFAWLLGSADIIYSPQLQSTLEAESDRRTLLHWTSVTANLDWLQGSLLPAFNGVSSSVVRHHYLVVYL